jgi:hypothetical protein
MRAKVTVNLDHIKYTQTYSKQLQTFFWSLRLLRNKNCQLLRHRFDRALVNRVFVDG